MMLAGVPDDVFLLSNTIKAQWLRITRFNSQVHEQLLWPFYLKQMKWLEKDKSAFRVIRTSMVTMLRNVMGRGTDTVGLLWGNFALLSVCCEKLIMINTSSHHVFRFSKPVFFLSLPCAHCTDPLIQLYSIQFSSPPERPNNYMNALRCMWR